MIKFMVAIWALLWFADAGFLQANMIHWRRSLALEFSYARPMSTRDRREDAANSIVIAATGPIGAVAIFMVTGAYQDGWINPFSRQFWVASNDGGENY